MNNFNTLFFIGFTSIFLKEIDGQGLVIIPPVTPNCQCVAPANCADGWAGIDPRVTNNPTAPLCIAPNRFCCNIIAPVTPVVPVCGTPPNPLIAYPAYVPTAGQATYTEYPWMAIIMGIDNRYISGAVLIDATTVITGAHRIAGLVPGVIKVRVGEYAIGVDTEPYRPVDIFVSAIRNHPLYNSVNLVNDIAIIKLTTPVDFVANPHIKPICLPAAGALYNGQRCWVSGYGATSTTGINTNILNEVDLPIIDGPTCQTRLQATRLGTQFLLNQQAFLCAGGESGKDACLGDGGSPLVCLSGTQWFLAGLVSWGIGCGDTVPGVYTNIPSFIQWITDNRL